MGHLTQAEVEVGAELGKITMTGRTHLLSTCMIMVKDLLSRDAKVTLNITLGSDFTLPYLLSFSFLTKLNQLTQTYLFNAFTAGIVSSAWVKAKDLLSCKPSPDHTTAGARIHQGARAAVSSIFCRIPKS